MNISQKFKRSSNTRTSLSYSPSEPTIPTSHSTDDSLSPPPPPPPTSPTHSSHYSTVHHHQSLTPVPFTANHSPHLLHLLLYRSSPLTPTHSSHSSTVHQSFSLLHLYRSPSVTHYSHTGTIYRQSLPLTPPTLAPFPTSHSQVSHSHTLHPLVMSTTTHSHTEPFTTHSTTPSSLSSRSVLLAAPPSRASSLPAQPQVKVWRS
ncbi:hypothetical protein E2C01_087265 [Portunus trituberculatus]|uniref:Uncharacterized protein n=1 Tax=Portunus trituberculatus TaxID=210409 RepID=A0A5B7J2W2_PORTR|nr:hypothetical protein [Portunus trituberculatus]